MKIRTLLILAASIFIFACESSTDPSEVGGETNLKLTAVGSEFGISTKIFGTDTLSVSSIRDSIKITKSENGIVTVKGKMLTDEKTLKSLDTMFGTQSLSDEMKHQFVDSYLAKYGITIDTTDRQNLKLEFEITLRVTSEGIQDYHYSNGDLTKPFTMVKYGSNVGDKYEFTTGEGAKITRTVVQKNPVEDWEISFWRVKTIRVEQMMTDDPIMKKVTFIGNHKYGLVGLIHEFKDGKVIKTTILPWGML